MIKENGITTAHIAATQKIVLIVSRIGVPFYALFVTYCAMVPFNNWVIPQHEILPVLLYGWIDKIFVFDVIQNLLLYLPLGFFAVFSFREKAWVLGLSYAFFISLVMCGILEYLQSYNPARVPSALDIILNTLSGFWGGAMAAMFYDRWLIWLTAFGLNMHRSSIRHPMPVVSLLFILFWGAYHWYPFLPTLHPGYIAQGYAPLLSTFGDLTLLNGTQFLSYTCQGVMLYALSLVAFKKRQFALILSFVIMILPFKILLIGRVLSFEAAAGTLLGLTLAFTLNYIFSESKNRPQYE